MCGIAGILGYRAKLPPKDICENFINTLAHRGPDGVGVYHSKEERVFLGHRRLSILDLSHNAKQPMSYSDERYWITYNGEIFNFQDIKHLLKKRGYRFKSDTDTEIILASYQEWGFQCQEKFNGMWAFVIWDREKKELFLSRDRFGIKPLHYYLDDAFFAFASEMKAFCALDILDLAFDTQEIANTIHNTNQLEASPNTIFKKIKKINGGCCAIFTSKGEWHEWQWWKTIDYIPEIPISYQEQCDDLKTLFLDACKLRMISDVSLASAVSGGLDSSSVVCSLSHLSTLNQCADRTPEDRRKAFCLYFPNTSFNELSYAKHAVKKANSSAIFLPVTPSQILNQVDDILFDFESIFDLPIGPWLLYREMKKNGIHISMDGHGADELFGGYYHHTEAAITESLFSIRDWKNLSVLHETLKMMYPHNYPEPIPGFSYSLIKSTLKKSSRTFLCAQQMFHRIRNIIKKRKNVSWLQIPPKIKKPTLQDTSNLSYLNQILYKDFHYHTLPSILRNFDRCSMAHGVEIRAPFLDWRVVCYSFALPTKTKISNGSTKKILRDAMHGIIPESIRRRKSKIGFANPLIEWMAKALKPFLLDKLHSQSFLSSNIWDGKLIKDQVLAAYDRKDYIFVRKCWEYVQADRLMEIFSNERERVML